jgi:sec-independent protein translocase protein TatC
MATSRPVGGRMPLADHLRELRRRVSYSLIAVAVLSLTGWFAYQPIIDRLAAPVCDLAAARESGSEACGILYISGVLGPLNLQFKVILITGVILAAPVWLYQAWAFVAPGLHQSERKKTVLFAALATPLFAAGAFLAYSILPMAVKILIGFTPSDLNNLVRFDEYLDFVLRMILVFGLAFELPIFLIALNIAGIVSGKTLLQKWRLATFLIFLFVAIFTPTGDPLTMIALALPLCLLYASALTFALLNDRRRSREPQEN